MLNYLATYRLECYELDRRYEQIYITCAVTVGGVETPPTFESPREADEQEICWEDISFDEISRHPGSRHPFDPGRFENAERQHIIHALQEEGTRKEECANNENTN